jgi:hypothetical protein
MNKEMVDKIERLFDEIFSAVDCPNIKDCENAGFYEIFVNNAIHLGQAPYDAEGCKPCYSIPNSKFNRNRIWQLIQYTIEQAETGIIKELVGYIEIKYALNADITVTAESRYLAKAMQLAWNEFNNERRKVQHKEIKNEKDRN